MNHFTGSLRRKMRHNNNETLTSKRKAKSDTSDGYSVKWITGDKDVSIDGKT